MLKKVFLGGKSFDFDENRSKLINLVTKFLLLKKEEKEILVCGIDPYIGDHSDIEGYFNVNIDKFDVNIGKFDDYEIIGAGSMNGGHITNLETLTYELKTSYDVALRILTYLDIPMSNVKNLKDITN